MNPMTLTLSVSKGKNQNQKIRGIRALRLTNFLTSRVESSRALCVPA